MNRFARISTSAGTLIAAAMLLTHGCKKEEPIKYPEPPPPDAAPPPPPPPPPVEEAPEPVDAGPAPLSAEDEKMLVDAVNHLATKHARGMKKQGDFIKGALAQGGQLTAPLQVEVGKCYGVVAMGGPVVTEVELEILAQNPLPIPLPGGGLKVAIDNTKGPEAAIDPCWKNVSGIPFPATVVIRAAEGTGPVGAQVYVK